MNVIEINDSQLKKLLTIIKSYERNKLHQRISNNCKFRGEILKFSINDIDFESINADIKTIDDLDKHYSKEYKRPNTPTAIETLNRIWITHIY